MKAYFKIFQEMLSSSSTICSLFSSIVSVSKVLPFIFLFCLHLQSSILSFYLILMRFYQPCPNFSLSCLSVFSPILLVNSYSFNLLKEPPQIGPFCWNVFVGCSYIPNKITIEFYIFQSSLVQFAASLSMIFHPTEQGNAGIFVIPYLEPVFICSPNFLSLSQILANFQSPIWMLNSWILFSEHQFKCIFSAPMLTVLSCDTYCMHAIKSVYSLLNYLRFISWLFMWCRARNNSWYLKIISREYQSKTYV